MPLKDSKAQSLSRTCMRLCMYLNKCNASFEVLVEHCGCSEPNVRRALKFMRDQGVPLTNIRDPKDNRHYWQLEECLSTSEAWVFLAGLHLDEALAQEVLDDYLTKTETAA